MFDSSFKKKSNMSLVSFLAKRECRVGHTSGEPFAYINFQFGNTKASAFFQMHLAEITQFVIGTEHVSVAFFNSPWSMLDLSSSRASAPTSSWIRTFLPDPSPDADPLTVIKSRKKNTNVGIRKAFVRAVFDSFDFSCPTANVRNEDMANLYKLMLSIIFILLSCFI